MNPTTSVTVVNTTPPANAGSMFMRRNISGMMAPEKAAMNKLITFAKPITTPSQRSENQAAATAATTTAHNTPYNRPIPSSR